MNSFLNYAIPGIPYGCDFALIAVGLVLTFRATGVFNLAFGAQAFATAFIFDVLVRTNGLPVWAAFVLTVLVFSPAFGLALDRFLFRFIPTASITAKVVVSLGLLIAIPQTLPIFFGNAKRLNPPHLWLSPDHVYFHLVHTPINGGDITTTVITVAVVAAVVAMFRWTAIGLQMRAVVESRRLAQLEGISAPAVAATAWALSSVLAGLAGVLFLPLTNELSPVDPLQFTALLVAGLTAAALASMRSISLAFAAAVALGIVQNLLHLLPWTGFVNSTLAPAFPFVVLVLALVFNPGLRTIELSSDPLATVDPPPAPPAVSVRDARLDRPTQVGFWLLVVAFIVSVATWLPGVWVTTFGQGSTLSIIFLSITLVTGMAGQLSLCQASFAGLGAFGAGQLAAHMGLSILVGSIVGGLIAAAVGAVVAIVAMRVSGLLLTLVTLAFALFCDQSLFQYSWLGGGVSGVSMPRPKIGPIDFGNGADRSYVVLTVVALAICMVLVLLVQRGTVGRYLAAMRGSPTAAASMGIGLRRARLTVFALSAGLAGFGGVLYGSLYLHTDSTSWVYAISLAFVVVVITTGSRTVEGAVQAGMAFAIFQTVLVLYLPARLVGIEPILFAVGAMTYAQHPEGIVEYQKTRWLARVGRLLRAYDERRARQSGTGVVGRAGPLEQERLNGVRTRVPVPSGDTFGV